MTQDSVQEKTLMIFSQDLDKAIAAFNIAVAAASMGSKVNMFFTFWGINVLRSKNARPKGKTFIEVMFGLMMPKGAERLVLSKLNMLGMGSWLMKWKMKKKNVTLLPDLIKLAQDMGVELIACEMTMDLMGFNENDLIGGLSIEGAAGYLERAQRSNLNLFI